MSHGGGPEAAKGTGADDAGVLDAGNRTDAVGQLLEELPLPFRRPVRGPWQRDTRDQHLFRIETEVDRAK